MSVQQFEATTQPEAQEHEAWVEKPPQPTCEHRWLAQAAWRINNRVSEARINWFILECKCLFFDVGI